VGFPILEFPDQTLLTLEDPFLQGICSGLSHLNASIWLHDDLVRPLARQGHYYIMAGLHSCGSFSKIDSLCVNYRGLYLGAYVASDIISPDGSQIHSGSFRGTLAQRPNTPSVKFPRQTRPNKVSWARWRRAFRLIFTAPRCTQLRLLEPLGLWFLFRLDSPKWYYYRSADSLVVRSRFTDAIKQYPLETRGRRALTYLKQHGTVVITLPSTSVPTAPPQEAQRKWISSPEAGLNFVPAPAPPLPPQTFANHVFVLDPALRALFSDVEILLPLAEIVTLLETSSTLTLVGDGGAKTCRGSYGAVAALDSIRILQIKGPPLLLS
jgi:hypothetical protein